MRDHFDQHVISEAVTINPNLTRSVNLSDEVSFIPMSDVSDTGRWTTHQTRKYAEVRAGYTAFQNGDILFAKITPCMENGKGCYVDQLVNGIGFGSTEFHVLRPKPGNDGRFVFHWLQTDMARRKAQTFMIGSAGQQRVQRNFFEHFLVPKLSLSLQRRIAEILDTIDEAIQKTEALIEKLKAMKQGLLHDLLTRGLDENGKLRDPKAHPEQFKDSPLGRIPKGWDIHSLKDFSKYISYGFTNPMPSTTEGPWMITAFDIGDGIIKYKQARHTSKYSFNHRLTLKSKPSKGDLLITKDGTLGRVAIVDSECLCINQSVACIRPLPNADISFLFHYLQAQNTQERMLADSGGSAIKHIYVSKLRNLEIVYPKRKEREKIVKIIGCHSTRIRTEEHYVNKLKLQKKGLMHDLLTGKVRVDKAAENVTS
jgi:type I restriction enzyme S subunit